jgi:hypothetical protein
MDIANVTKTEDVVLDFTKSYPDLPPEEATLNVTINPAFLTPAKQKELEKNADDSDTVVEALVELVVKWDLVNNGKVVPLDRKSLSDVPFVVLGLVMRGIAQQMIDKAEAEGKA